MAAGSAAGLAAVTRRLEHERTRRRTAIVRESRRAQRSARASDGFADGDLDAFSDPVEQFRHEVHLAWTRRIAKSDKRDRPLAEYTVGRRFLASLTAIDGVERRKVVDVVVDVLTGLADELDSRELHKLRVDGGGGSRPVVREDGATCLRVALQRGTRPRAGCTSGAVDRAGSSSSSGWSCTTTSSRESSHGEHGARVTGPTRAG